MTTQYKIQSGNTQDSRMVTAGIVGGSDNHKSRTSPVQGGKTSKTKEMTLGTSPEPDIVDLPKEKRLEKAKEMMAEMPEHEVSLDDGEVTHFTQDVLIEKTEEGFVIYHVQG